MATTERKRKSESPRTRTAARQLSTPRVHRRSANLPSTLRTHGRVFGLPHSTHAEGADADEGHYKTFPNKRQTVGTFSLAYTYLSDMRYRLGTVWCRMFAVIADRAPVQKMTSLTMASKPRLNFLSAPLVYGPPHAGGNTIGHRAYPVALDVASSRQEPAVDGAQGRRAVEPDRALFGP